MIDDLKSAERTLIDFSRPQPTMTFNALFVISNELAVLLPEYDRSFTGALTDMWDGRQYHEKKRTKNTQIKMEHPTVNILAATTPSYLNELLPEGAWDQGLMSRVMLIFSGEVENVNLWPEFGRNEKLFADLIADLKQLGALVGEMHIPPDTKNLIIKWIAGRCEPRPDHPRLLNYVSRRPAQLLKLCMSASASRSNDLVIRPDDFQRALDWLFQAEHAMPSIFHSMASGGARKVIEELWHFIYQIYVKEQKPVAEPRVIGFLTERADPHMIARIIEVMVRSEVIKEVIEKYGKAYVPRAKRPQ